MKLSFEHEDLDVRLTEIREDGDGPADGCACGILLGNLLRLVAVHNVWRPSEIISAAVGYLEDDMTSHASDEIEAAIDRLQDAADEVERLWQKHDRPPDPKSA